MLRALALHVASLRPTNFVRGRLAKPADGAAPVAGRQGVEPRFSGPEPLVLPLNDLPTGRNGMRMLHGAKRVRQDGHSRRKSGFSIGEGSVSRARGAVDRLALSADSSPSSTAPPGHTHPRFRRLRGCEEIHSPFSAISLRASAPPRETGFFVRRFFAVLHRSTRPHAPAVPAAQNDAARRISTGWSRLVAQFS
jgi:hypothetical protein